MILHRNGAAAIQRRVARAEQLREGRPLRIELPCAECGGPQTTAAMLVRRNEGAIRAWIEAHGGTAARTLDAFVTHDGHVVVSLPADAIARTWRGHDCANDGRIA